MVRDLAFFAMMAAGVKGRWAKVGLLVVGEVILLLVLRCTHCRRNVENDSAAIGRAR